MGVLRVTLIRPVDDKFSNTLVEPLYHNAYSQIRKCFLTNGFVPSDCMHTPSLISHFVVYNEWAHQPVFYNWS